MVKVNCLSPKTTDILVTSETSKRKKKKVVYFLKVVHSLKGLQEGVSAYLTEERNRPQMVKPKIEMLQFSAFPKIINFSELVSA